MNEDKLNDDIELENSKNERIDAVAADKIRQDNNMKAMRDLSNAFGRPVSTGEGVMSLIDALADEYKIVKKNLTKRIESKSDEDKLNLIDRFLKADEKTGDERKSMIDSAVKDTILEPLEIELVDTKKVKVDEVIQIDMKDQIKLAGQLALGGSVIDAEVIEIASKQLLDSSPEKNPIIDEDKKAISVEGKFAENIEAANKLKGTERKEALEQATSTFLDRNNINEESEVGIAMMNASTTIEKGADTKEIAKSFKKHADFTKNAERAINTPNSIGSDKLNNLIKTMPVGDILEAKKAMTGDDTSKSKSKVLGVITRSTSKSIKDDITKVNSKAISLAKPKVIKIK